MSKVIWKEGVNLNNLPPVQVIDPYRDRIKKNLGDLVCDYFEFSTINGRDMDTQTIALSTVIQDICRVLELNPAESAEFTECVEVEIVAGWRD